MSGAGEPFGGFYRGRRVIVTGHTGFKGAWLAIWLRHLGAEVLGYALAPEQPDGVFTAVDLAGSIPTVIADIRDEKRLHRAFEEHRPEVAFHLAAQAYVLKSYAEPKATFETNVCGTINFLEASRATPSLRAAICVTSDKCYENVEQIWPYRERDRLGGRDPYSASKGAAELAIRSYAESFFPPGGCGIASARAGNVIGGGDYGENRIVADAVRALRRSVSIPVRNPGAVRPWQHVLEPLSGYLHLAERVAADTARYAGAWNFGPRPEEVVRVDVLVDAVLRAWGSGTVARAESPPLHEASLLSLDCTKARLELGWDRALSFEQAVELTVEWYRRQHAGAGAAALRDACVEQIDRYSEIASRGRIAWASG